ncbi:MAG: ECF RNA polymerase sigma factor SigE [Phycisphaerae bacterium]|nr:ECF RNA polymerase sigma factor SigE [Phycisphaerae bacterium]
MTASAGWVGVLPALVSGQEADRRRLVERMFDRCRVGLYRYVAVRVGNDQALADDLMQQLWIKVSRSDRMIPSDEFEFWLRRLAKNLINDHWRKVLRRPEHVPLENPQVATELSRRMDRELLPLELLEQQELRDQLLLAITELGSEEQDLIIRHYVRGEMFAEMAQVLGISERAVEGRLYRARQQLRYRLAHLEEPT